MPGPLESFKEMHSLIEGDVRVLEEYLSSVTREIDGLQKELSSREAHIRRLAREKDLSEKKAALAALQKELGSAREKLHVLGQRHEEKDERLKQEESSLRAHITAQEESLKDAERHHAQLATDADRLRKEKEKLRLSLEEARQQLL